MRKHSRLVFVLIFIASIFLVGSADSNFSEKEKRAFGIIHQVKDFEKTIGFCETSNFTSFSENADCEEFICWEKREDMAFSYSDPKMRTTFDLKEFEAFRSATQNFDEKYECIIALVAVSGGTIITRTILSLPDSSLAEIVLHEDFHDNICLPTHINEASALLMGMAGSAKFWGKSREEIKAIMDRMETEANLINRYYDALNAWGEDYKSGRISWEEFIEGRNELVEELRGKASAGDRFLHKGTGPVSLCLYHSYTYYFPLMNRLFASLDYDPARFLKIMKELSCPYPVNFDEKRKWEKKLEGKIEEIIKENSK